MLEINTTEGQRIGRYPQPHSQQNSSSTNQSFPTSVDQHNPSPDDPQLVIQPVVVLDNNTIECQQVEYDSTRNAQLSPNSANELSYSSVDQPNPGISINNLSSAELRLNSVVRFENNAEGQHSGAVDLNGTGQFPNDANVVGQQQAKVVYTGTSGYSGHKRLIEHSKAISGKNMKNALAKHMMVEHSSIPAEDGKFKTKFVKTGINFNLSRYITESLTIEETRKEPGTQILNSKSEWGHTGVSRLKVVRE